MTRGYRLSLALLAAFAVLWCGLTVFIHLDAMAPLTVTWQHDLARGIACDLGRAPAPVQAGCETSEDVIAWHETIRRRVFWQSSLASFWIVAGLCALGGMSFLVARSVRRPRR